MKQKISILMISALSIYHPLSYAQENSNNVSPQAGGRTYAQNYKDMVLAECIATAYTKDSSNVVKDAGSSASALRDWTYYDFETNPYSIVTAIIATYLSKDYTNPLVESEVKGVRFDLLKCLDLYHSQELHDLVMRVVINPEMSPKKDKALLDRITN